MSEDITYAEHRKDKEEFAPYIDLLEDAEEHQTVVKELYGLSSIDYLSEEFQQAYYREIRAQLKWFKENTTIKEAEKKVVTQIEAYKYLEYDNE